MPIIREIQGEATVMATGSGDKSYEILLVEENEGDVRLTQDLLKDSGVAHNLSVVGDGKTALAMLR